MGLAATICMQAFPLSLPGKRLRVVDILENIDARNRVSGEISHTVLERVLG